MTSVPFSHAECGVQLAACSVQRASSVCISKLTYRTSTMFRVRVCSVCVCVQSILIFVVTTISVILGSLKLDLYIVRDHSPGLDQKKTT